MGFTSILKQKIRFPRWLRQDTLACLQGFLERNPDRRLGAGPNGQADIKGCKYLSSIKWADVQARKLKPPIKPQTKNTAANFDSEFTSDAVTVTPADEAQLKTLKQEVFTGFTFVPGTVEE